MKEPYSPIRPKDHGLWTCLEPEASEDEICELIGALAFALKPVLAVEIGTHQGQTACQIGEAMRRTGRGHLHTFEVVEANALASTEFLQRVPTVTVHRSDGAITDIGEDWEVDFLFIDGNIDNRLAIFRHWHDRVVSGGYVLVHDSLKFAQVGAHVAEMMRYMPGCQRLDIASPRGLTLLRKP